MRTTRACAGATTRRWRGVSGQFADCGIHALHMASFIAGDQVDKVSADFASTIDSRVLEDDAMVNFRMSRGGTVGRLWTSSVAIGRQHGFDIQVFGETGGLRWASEQPNQVFYTPVGGRTQIMEKGEAGLSGGGGAAQPGGDCASRRVSAGRGEHLCRPRRRDPGRSAGRVAHGGGWRALHGGGLCRRRLGRRPRARGPTRGPRCSARARGGSVPRSITRQGNSRVSGCRFGALDGRDDKVDGGFDDLGDGLADRGQVDVLPARHLHVVEPDQADVARHATAPPRRLR
jgi:hypothetical protein